ncbi:sulfotransferase [Sphingobium sp. JS3065]|uniref:sulfotransferase family protein n=1 Tax=Sphingobium sp. JS3065 TaxID=2970925 RepID=UPI0022646476|nr:sulfotransferase [Sphingobium sp. JS3065]UZW57382.1 sulfotransferase [Sphingobium sp. JS3065]
MTRSDTLDLINEEALHEQAAARAGSSDFGDDAYREGLGVLLSSARNSARLEAIAGRVSSLVVDTLVSRLSSQAGWNAEPQVLQNPVTAPLVITGLPRSGTTLLHFLMSLDPQFQWTPRWVGEAPLVLPPQEEWEGHPQYQAVHDRLEAMFTANPGLRQAHEMGAGLADECITVMVQSFVSNMFISMLPLPEYREWFFQTDETPSYRRYKDNLRLMGARAPEKTWLLKNPSHTIGMGPLLTTFPDARVVVLHRNPVETIASGASLTYRNAKFWEKTEVGPIRLDVYSRAVKRMAEAREQNPGHCLDIGYRDLVSDPLGTVRRIYAHYGLQMSEETAAAMETWLAANPQGKHGKHAYSSEEYGISDADVRSAFADYIAEYDLER